MAISGSSAVAVEWCLAAVALTFVLFRGYVKLIHQAAGLSLSDAFILLAFASFIACCSCDTELNRLGLFAPGWNYSRDLTTISADKHTVVEILKVLFFLYPYGLRTSSILTAVKIVYGSALPYYMDLWLIKSSLLCFYYQIIPNTVPKLRKALYVATGAVAVTFLIVICVNSFWCRPLWRNWTLDKNEVCFSFASYPVFFISVGCNVITDIIILILPFPLLRDLRVPRSQTYALIFIFSLGSMCIIATVSRVIALALNASTTQVAVWSAIETSVGIIVACLPALRVLLRTQRQVRSTRSGIGGSSNSISHGRNASGIRNAALSGSAKIPVSRNSEWIKLSESSSRLPNSGLSKGSQDRELQKSDHGVVLSEIPIDVDEYDRSSVREVTRPVSAHTPHCPSGDFEFITAADHP